MLGMMIAARAFALARWRALRLRTRADIEKYQGERIARMIAHVLPRFPYYRDRLRRGFDGLPVIDKQVLLDNFAQLNRGGLTVPQVRAALDRGSARIGDYVVGQSTGTSGNRGYYVIDDAERFVWLGTILAKALPDALWRRHRVALALPGLSDLYRSASTGSRIALGFFDLAQGVDRWAGDLVAFAPDTIVAPPKVLRYLAEAGQLPAEHIFSGAEVLDPLDREIIEAVTGYRVREIYMATEGLLGVGCTHGTLHLAEDVVNFEWQSAGLASALVAPVVTDFTRGAQAMVRYRMNDLLRLADEPCACGSAYQAVARIEGRNDDSFRLAAVDGMLRIVTPDVVRNAVVDADPAIRDFRAVQTGASAFTVTLSADLPDDLDACVLAKLADRLAPFALAPLNITIGRGLTYSHDVKLRRVRRDWSPS